MYLQVIYVFIIQCLNVYIQYILYTFTFICIQDYDYEEQLQLHPHEELEMSYNAAKKRAAKKRVAKRKSLKETNKKLEEVIFTIINNTVHL